MVENLRGVLRDMNGSQVLTPKSDMDAYMATLGNFPWYGLQMSLKGRHNFMV